MADGVCRRTRLHGGEDAGLGDDLKHAGYRKGNDDNDDAALVWFPLSAAPRSYHGGVPVELHLRLDFHGVQRRKTEGKKMAAAAEARRKGVGG